MRKGYSKQRRLDTESIDQIQLNLECRDEKTSFEWRRIRDNFCLLRPAATSDDVFGDHTLPAFIARTERVQYTAERRVIRGETVPNSDKLFSMFEPHTQRYKRGKAGDTWAQTPQNFRTSAKAARNVCAKRDKIIQNRFFAAHKSPSARRKSPRILDLHRKTDPKRQPFSAQHSFPDAHELTRRLLTSGSIQDLLRENHPAVNSFSLML